MRLAWGPRQILAVVSLTAVLILLSGLVELADTVRLAADGAAVESGLIVRTLQMQVVELVSQSAGDPAESLRRDRRVSPVLEAATIAAPSVAWVAICDTSGTALAHTNPDLVGQRLAGPELLPLPRSHNLVQSLHLLASLRRSPPFYEERRALRFGGRPFADIRVGIAGGLLRARVTDVFRRRLVVAGVQILVALLVGALLSGILRFRLRQMEEGVTALREGRFHARIPESGVDEFSRLARDLNLLGEQFAREGRGPETSALRETVEMLGHGVLTLGPSLEVVLLNGPAGRALGLTPAAMGRPLAEVLPDDHPVRRLADALVHDGATSLTVPLPDEGENGKCVLVGHRIAGQDGPGGVLVEIKEVAALQRLHSMADRSRIFSRLGQMATGVAHEIRNPLQAIGWELSLLRRSRDLPAEELQAHVSTALEAMQRLQRAVTGFLKVARLQKLAPAPLRPGDLLAEVYRAQETEANLAALDLELAVEADLPVLVGDREVLRQALQNLISNAVQALPSRSGRVVLRGYREAGMIVFAVQDDGPGIPPENRDKIFDLYFTTKEAGTGVGLALVRQAAEMHRGEVAIDSEPGRGTTVAMRLPLEDE
jgi:signal transduction histidine kinase